MYLLSRVVVELVKKKKKKKLSAEKGFWASGSTKHNISIERINDVTPHSVVAVVVVYAGDVCAVF